MPVLATLPSTWPTPCSRPVPRRLAAAGRIFAVDCIADRLDAARAQGAEAIDFDSDDPVETIQALTGGIGVDCAIDAVGVDAECPRTRTSPSA